jgi:DNA-binding NarL/FixJ family response regulator
LILIVDDHPLVGEALRDALRRADPGREVAVTQTAVKGAASARAHAAKIKLVLLDLLLPDASGFSALLELQQLLPECPIAMISSRTDGHTVALARAFGCAGYLSKSDPLHRLVETIEALLAGRTVFPADSNEVPETPDVEPFRTRIASLSPAQLRVLLALADGRLNKQIAADMGLTEGTVKQHFSAIFRKLGVQNRSQALLLIQPYASKLAPQNQT